MNDRKNNTNWYVITGGPSSGKTTTVNLLKARGYKTTTEHARHYLDTQRINGKTVTKWQPPVLKEWETIGEAKIIIMSWYRMWFEIFPQEKETKVRLTISYLPPKYWFNKILSFFFAKWYCNWCLNNMLSDSKRNLEKIQIIPPDKR